MVLTKQQLENSNACNEAIIYFEENKLEGKGLKFCIKKATKDKHLDWCNWIVTRLMTKEQCIQYAIFAVELVVNIYENQYPDDDRPRKAIEAAKDYLNKPNKQNQAAANEAANAAYAKVKTKTIKYGLKLLGD